MSLKSIMMVGSPFHLRMSAPPQDPSLLTSAPLARAAAQGGIRPSLTLDPVLVIAAQQWANNLASSDSLDHDTNAGAGENLYMSSGSTTHEDAANAWVNEKNNYHGEAISDGDFENYGHYTQVIWPETTRMGIASATSASGAMYIVGRYLPQDNMSGQTAWRPGPGVPKPTQDGVFLVNSYKDGQASSGFAWYRDLVNSGGKQPDAYIDIKTDGVVTWEGHTYSGSFGDGNVFTVTIDENGQTVPLYTKCGHAKNKFRTFDVHRDNVRVIYEVDGWKANCIYYC